MSEQRQTIPCAAQMEPGAKPRATHTCNQSAGHVGAHHCPVCGTAWRPVGAAVGSTTEER